MGMHIPLWKLHHRRTEALRTFSAPSVSNPNLNALPGKMKLTMKDGSVKEITDTFFWIIVSMRSPYNGRLTGDLWVSYMRLENFPGFGRMMDYFKPPMELFLGCATVMEAHYCISKFEWDQVRSNPLAIF